MFDWLKEKTSGRSLFGKNSLFSSAFKTVTAQGITIGSEGITIGGRPDTSGAEREAELLKYGIIGLFGFMVVKMMSGK